MAHTRKALGGGAGTVNLHEALQQTLDSEEVLPRDGGAEPAGAPPPTGSERFERGRELGRGGMGRVVEAVDRQFNRVVAIKEMHARGATGDARRRLPARSVSTLVLVP